MLDNGATVEHLHGNTLPSFRILCELYLGKGSFSNGPSNLILAHFPQHHLALSLLSDNQKQCEHKNTAMKVFEVNGIIEAVLSLWVLVRNVR